MSCPKPRTARRIGLLGGVGATSPIVVPVLRRVEHDDVAGMRVAQVVDRLVHQDPVAGAAGAAVQRLLHRLGRDVEGLDDEGLDQDRDQDREDDQRGQLPPRRLALGLRLLRGAPRPCCRAPPGRGCSRSGGRGCGAAAGPRLLACGASVGRPSAATRLRQVDVLGLGRQPPARGGRRRAAARRAPRCRASRPTRRRGRDPTAVLRCHSRARISARRSRASP